MCTLRLGEFEQLFQVPDARTPEREGLEGSASLSCILSSLHITLATRLKQTDKQNAVLRLLPWDREWETFEPNIWLSGGETSGSKSKWTLFHVQRGQFCARKCKCPRRSARGLKDPTEGSVLHRTSGEK